MHRLQKTILIALTFFTIDVSSKETPEIELRAQYEHICSKPSDIQGHIPLLRELARDCSSVIEIGMRDMVSSWGIFQGLAENPSKNCSYLGIDITHPPFKTLSLARKLLKAHDISFDLWVENDMNITIPTVELLFIDSLHTYCHLTYELETFSPNVSKYIALHDTSDPWGNCDDSEYKGDYSEYPAFIDRSKRGLFPAVTDFLLRHPEWILQERHFNDHGFTILKRISLD